ncbi:MAG: sulfatase-like hydrolase/transferase, partial [Candidatus Eisenbacteria bacterium]|nr:sulfatase-like hydrolase/transferase [Candidatus Eisenbacteria bacterium]
VLAALAVAPLLRPQARAGIPAALRPGAAQGFNVLLITLDTTRADHLGCYGYADVETPAIDGLARAGILFGDAVCTSPITLPSHATMLTGLDPPNHGARVNGQSVVGPEQETLAEILGAAGYETAAFISAFVLESRFGLDQGFDLYDDDIGTAQSAGTGAENLNQRIAGDVTRSTLSWLERRDRGRPFFAWVHYFDPHNPYMPPQPFLSRYRDRPYDGEIAYMDSEIARLLAAVDRLGYRERTLILAVGDHGEGLGEHGESTHERLIYDSVMRVPLILACPGLFRGPYRVDDVVVATTDVFPTVLELLGLQGTRPIDGISLLACREQGQRAVYMESMAPYLTNGWAPLFGLRRHTDKYILAPRPEYYDLRRDPRELNDLYATAPGAAAAARDELVADLRARLDRWPSPEGVRAATAEVDYETRQRLESLGYISTATSFGDPTALPDPKDMMPVLEGIDRANALMRAGRLDQALTAIRRAGAISPRDPHVLLTMGKILLFQEKDAEAEETLRRSIEIHPLADACLLAAQLMIKQARHDDAEALLEQGRQLEPLHGGLWIARGDLAGLRGDHAAALA